MLRKNIRTKARKKGISEEDVYLTSIIKEDEDGAVLTHREKCERGKYQRKPVASGFKEDVIKILRLFADGNSLEFSQFGELWLNHNFALLYMGRENERELSETAYEMFGITLSFLTDPKLDFNMKVGAIYLLYCLYEKQPFHKHRVKIRILEEDYRTIKTIFEVARETGLTNCVYIILKLIYDHAFHFVGSRFLMGPESSDYRNHPDKSDPIILNTWSTEFQELWNKGSFQARKVLEDEIKVLKCELGIEHLIPDNEASTSKLLAIGAAVARGDDSVFAMLNDDTDKLENDVSIGVRRVKIKERQLQAKCANPMPRQQRGKHSKYSDSFCEEIDVDDPLNITEVTIPIIKEEKDVQSKEKRKSESDSIDECALSDNERHLLELGIVIEKPNKSTRKSTSTRKSKGLTRHSPSRKPRKPKGSQSKTDDEDDVAYITTEEESGTQSDSPKGTKKKTPKKKKKTVRKGSATKKFNDSSAEAETPNKTSSETNKVDSPKSDASKKSPTKSVGKMKRFVRKTSWRKARIIGRSRPEKKIMKGKKIKYYDDSEEENIET